MTLFIEEYEHRDGVHGGSTAMRNLLGWAGFDFSEPMVFGLGAGLDFHYFSGEAPPTRRILGRTLSLEEQVAQSLGLALHPIESRSAQEGWSAIEAHLADGVPVLIRCDGTRLPYRDRQAPFGAHRVVIVGFDSDGGEICVSDGTVAEQVWIDREALLRAWWSESLSETQNGGAAFVLEAGQARDLDDAIRRAVARNCRAMTTRGDRAHGLDALSQFREEVGRWKTLDDGIECYRAAYEAMENRETGGGNFRNLYRDFLTEAEEIVPSLGGLQAGLSMTRTADAWSTLGTYLSAMTTYLETEGEEPGENPAHHVESMAEAAYQFESTFWNRIGSLDG